MSRDGDVSDESVIGREEYQAERQDSANERAIISASVEDLKADMAARFEEVLAAVRARSDGSAAGGAAGVAPAPMYGGAGAQGSSSDAVVTELGRRATDHVEVPLPSERETPPPFPPGCRIPPGSGGGRSDSFFVKLYVDDGSLSKSCGPRLAHGVKCRPRRVNRTISVCLAGEGLGTPPPVVSA